MTEPVPVHAPRTVDGAHEPAALRDNRRRVAWWIGWIGVATALTTTIVALLPGTSSISPLTVVGLLSLTLPGSGAVVWTARSRSDRAVVRSLRVLLPLALLVILAGTTLAPQQDVVGLAFLGFVYLLASMSLPQRDGLVLLAVGSVGATAVALADGSPLGIWPLLASVSTGALAHAAGHVQRRTLRDLEDQRVAAQAASGALRAVIEGAGEATSGDVEEVFGAVVTATRALDCQMAAIARLVTGGALDAAAASGLPIAEAGSIFANREGIAARVVTRGTTIVRNDYAEYEHRIRRSQFEPVLAAMGTPVRVDGEIWGALVAARTTPVPIGPAAVDALELLAAHAGRAIALARAVGEDRSRLRGLQRLHELQDDFVSTVSHELRTPLTVIDGAAETLVERGALLPAETSDQLLRSIARNARGLDQVIGSILELSRLDRGLVEFAPEAVALGELVEDAVARVGPVLAGHEVVVATADCRALGDGDLIQRAVDNLLINAARHTPPGTRVEVSVTCEGPGALVRVADDGPGVAATDLPHITERFRRAGPVTRRGGRGLGIGLALVEQVVRLHGSRLVVESTPGEGATFSFRLPLAPTTDEDPDARPVSP